jgi:NAD(P)-dependent dehydrogenase (short-subunit alcohol dehydrogenase family)
MNNPTVLITGGTGKLGKCFVKHFLKKEWNVLFTTTNIKNKKELEKSFNNNSKLKGYVVDFLKKEECSNLIRKINKENFSINHLINAARNKKFLKIDKKFGMPTRDNFSKEFILDVFIPYELSIKIFNKKKNNLRTVTNIGSQYGLVTATPKLYKNYFNDYPIQYSVAKAGLMHLTKELAIRFSKSNTRVNCLVLGGVKGRVNSSFENRYKKLSPMGRMLSEEDALGPLDLIMNENSKAINGQTIIADGGWTLW